MRRPLIYFAVSMCFGCLSLILFIDSFLLGAVIAASFLVLIIFTVDKSFSLQISAFFFMGMISCLIYFNISIDSTKLYKVRVVEKNQYYSVGNYKNRKIVISGDTKNIKQGDLLDLEGNFTKNCNYSKGVVGVFDVKKYNRKPNDIFSNIYSFKTDLFKSFSQYMDKDKAGFVMAICFGDVSNLDSQQKNDFQKLGVVHAISVSGFHLAVIYKIFEKLFGIYPSIFLSLIYVIFTGGQPSTIRAFLMIFFLKFSKKFNKNYDSISSIALSAMAILVFKPFYILDWGFTLSYLSTLSILLFNKKVQRKLIFLPNKLNESISICLSSQILSIPYAAFCIKNISTGFILGNVFLLPLYTVIVVVGNTALVFYKIKEVFIILNKFLNLMLISIDGATYFLMEICPPMKYFTTLESLILTLFIISIMLAKSGRKQAKYILILLSGLLLFENYSFVPEVTYINYGKSDSVIIKYKGSTVLITDEPSGKKLSNIKKEYRTTRILSASDGENILKLSRRYKIVVSGSEYYKDKSKSMKVEFYSNSKKILFTRENEIQTTAMNNKNYCDIIVLPENNKLQPIDFTSTNTFTYLIVFGKAFNF